jgi:DNA repair protein RecO (recombination protein O)
MAHHVYNTHGFVLESTPRGEANKLYSIFTEELGMIRAVAQGVRLLKSKLRFSLQEFSYVSLSVVRGKDVWRITNARSEWNLYSLYKNRKDVFYILAQVFVLLRRLIPGEEKNEILFKVLTDALEFLRVHHLEEKETGAFERILILKILHSLGYIGTSSELNDFISSAWSAELVSKMAPHAKQATAEINRAIRESQL